MLSQGRRLWHENAIRKACRTDVVAQLADELYKDIEGNIFLVLSYAKSALWGQVCADNNLYSLKQKLWQYMGEDGFFYVYKLRA